MCCIVTSCGVVANIRDVLHEGKVGRGGGRQVCKTCYLRVLFFYIICIAIFILAFIIVCRQCYQISRKGHFPLKIPFPRPITKNKWINPPSPIEK